MSKLRLLLLYILVIFDDTYSKVLKHLSTIPFEKSSKMPQKCASLACIFLLLTVKKMQEFGNIVHLITCKFLWAWAHKGVVNEAK